MENNTKKCTELYCTETLPLLKHCSCIRAYQCKCCPLLADICISSYRSSMILKGEVQQSAPCESVYLEVYVSFCVLTWVCNRNPLVELIVVGHSVKLTAQHLSKCRFVVLTGFCITGAITLPFPSAVFAPELWSG